MPPAVRDDESERTLCNFLRRKLVTADVVEDGLDDMGRDAEFDHAGSSKTLAAVGKVQPRPKASIKGGLPFRPSGANTRPSNDRWRWGVRKTHCSHCNPQNMIVRKRIWCEANGCG
jgi:hypothetical protein